MNEDSEVKNFPLNCVVQMFSVCPLVWSSDVVAMGCEVQSESRFEAVFVGANSSVRVPIKHDSQDLQCCASASDGSATLAVFAAGLSSAEVTYAVCVRSKVTSQTTLEGRVLSVGGSRGGVNCMTATSLWPPTLFVGCQNGDVLRISLAVSKEGTLSIVGSVLRLYTHRMDVRGLALAGNAWLCSVSDDGTAVVHSVASAGESTATPIIDSSCELLCCAFQGERVLVGSREWKLLSAECWQLAGSSERNVKKAKKATAEAGSTTVIWIVPHVPRVIWTLPGGKILCLMQSGICYEVVESTGCDGSAGPNALIEKGPCKGLEDYVRITKKEK